MSLPHRPVPVKPLVSLIFSQPSLETAVFRELAAFLGPPDLVSAWLPFDQTRYYEPEMGAQLQRRLAVFLHLADPGALSQWKRDTNQLERRFSLGGRRLVNIDPGHLGRERLVLATGKNYTHRLYLGEGIYGEVTLIFQKGGWQTLPWTYPDYAGEALRQFFGQARQKYLWQLRQLASLGQGGSGGPA